MIQNKKKKKFKFNIWFDEGLGKILFHNISRTKRCSIEKTE